MSTKTVLVVDDEPHIRYILHSKLGAAGYEVITAGNGDEGYELACAHVPDLVITDLQMPGSSGLELCKRLIANDATAAVPAIMLTARGHKVTPTELASTNIRDLLPKPFSVRQLLAKVEELFGVGADLAA